MIVMIICMTVIICLGMLVDADSRRPRVISNECPPHEHDGVGKMIIKKLVR